MNNKKNLLRVMIIGSVVVIVIALLMVLTSPNPSSSTSTTGSETSTTTSNSTSDSSSASESSDETSSDAVESSTSEDVMLFNNSVLYYGEVTSINNEGNDLKSIVLNSEKYGEYIMNVSSDTVFIDESTKSKFDATDLEVGDTMYIYHSMISTRSLPPQSEAYIVLINTPADAGCAVYRKVNSVIDGNEIVVDDLNSSILVSDDTKFVDVDGNETDSVKGGNTVLIWGVDMTGNIDNTADTVMILPDVESTK